MIDFSKLRRRRQSRQFDPSDSSRLPSLNEIRGAVERNKRLASVRNHSAQAISRMASALEQVPSA